MAIWPAMTSTGPCLASYQPGSRTLRLQRLDDGGLVAVIIERVSRTAAVGRLACCDRVVRSFRGVRPAAGLVG
jgi:hypothetical protein